MSETLHVNCPPETHSTAGLQASATTQDFSSEIQILETSLVAQRMRIHLPVQGSRVPSLVPEDPTCCGATKPVHYKYGVLGLQLPKPMHLEPVLHSKRSRCSERPEYHNQREPAHSKDSVQPQKIRNKKAQILPCGPTRLSNLSVTAPFLGLTLQLK